jgi:hypothetical protein
MAEEKSEVFRSNAPKEMGINEGSDAKRKKRPDGPVELRQITDHHAVGTAGKNETGTVDIAKQAGDASSGVVIAKQDNKAEEPAVEPALIEKDDAIPWALSIHLEERIKKLGSRTATVNLELDALEAASEKLARRIGK